MRWFSHVALMTLMIAGLTACSTGPRPTVLKDAQRRISSPELAELETSQPKLVREARERLAAAEEAFARGEEEPTRLHASIAVQKVDTARNLVDRGKAVALTSAMREADEGLDNELARLGKERDELARYDALESRFVAVRDELAGIRADDRSQEAEAKRRVVAARQRQAQALRAGAPSSAPELYREGDLLVGVALEALQNGLFAESLEASQSSIDQFDLAINRAKDSDVAKRRADEEAAASKATQAADARAKAEAALDRARTAKAAAEAARLEQTRPETFERASALLELAESRFIAGEFAGSLEKAERAVAVFSPGAPQSASPSLIALAPTEDPRASRAREAIYAAEDARLDAIGNGLGEDPRVRRADFSLQIARDSVASGDYGRAVAKAEEALSTYRMLRFERPAARPVADSGLAANRGGLSSSLSAAVEERLVNLTFERAERLGQGADALCPQVFKEFDAILALARERHQAGDDARALEFAIRAAERLRKCDTGEGPTASAAPTTAAPAVNPAVRPPATAACLKLQRDVLTAERAETRLDTRTLTPDHRKTLKSAQKLVATSRPLGEQGKCEAAAVLVEQATRLYGELDKATDPRTATVPGSVPPATIAAEKTGPMDLPPPVDTDVEATTIELLARARLLEIKHKSHAKEDTYKLAAQMLGEAKTAIASDKYTLADRLLRQSLKAFHTYEPKATAKTAPLTKVDARREAVVVEQLARAQLLEAKHRKEKGDDVYKLAASLLADARKAFEGRRIDVAERLVAQSIAGFATFEPKDQPSALTQPAKPAAEARSRPANPAESRAQRLEDDKRQAQSRYIEAVLRRDRAASVATGSQRALMARGDSYLRRYLQAVDRDDFPTARRYAQAAEDTFIEVERSATAAPTADPGTDKVKALEAQLAAERKRRADAENARQAEARKRAEAEKHGSEADKARARAEAEAQARKKADEDREAREAAAARSAAEKKLLDARVAYEVCVREDCKKRHASKWGRSSDKLTQAQARFDAGDFAAAATLADEARTVFVELATQEAKPKGFIVPDKAKGVVFTAGRLQVEPKLTFQAGTSTLTPGSARALDSLAAAILSNQAGIARVSVIGFTDSRGAEAQNLKISRARADAVLRALVSRGVPARLLAAEGRGEAEPVADNRTAAGREANRRVELRVIEK